VGRKELRGINVLSTGINLSERRRRECDKTDSSAFPERLKYE
jgi:hypothetical protein